MLRHLTIHNLRSIADASIEPQSGLNLIVGGNGSGKTTLLEAIYLLAKGRSFRHRETSPLVREGQRDLHLFAEFDDANAGTHRLGMQRQEGQWQVRLDGQNARRRSEILAMMPIQWIGADPQSLVTGTPEVRRAFLDGGMFHVEHRYLEVLQSYNRALDQRNAALRARSANLDGWDSQLSGFAAQLDDWRASYIEGLVEQVEAILSEWDLKFGLEVLYHRGWAEGMTLDAAFNTALETDRKRGFTSVGPQRADFAIRTGTHRSGKKLSRGQLKMVAAALYLAQSIFQRINGQGSGTLLFDDLPAELDATNREKLIVSIESTYDQAFLAALSVSDLQERHRSCKVFHVEHGVVQSP